MLRERWVAQPGLLERLAERFRDGHIHGPAAR